jgi:hypothetical protein
MQELAMSIILSQLNPSYVLKSRRVNIRNNFILQCSFKSFQLTCFKLQLY